MKKKAILTIEIESNLSLVDLKHIAKEALTVFNVTVKGTLKVVQVQANRIK